ncbi:DUF4350 domain-containing protein [Ectopseudomonas mendocina]|uniref:DUF4350 domain-containing protein n=1 Tax=Ectopseudomonas mendocina TaxID=300 RepID=A0ABZ2RCZ2_ECTME
MSRSLRISLLIVLAVLVLLAGYLGSQLSPYEETVEHGPAPEALANPYLAAERFLQERGLQVTQADNLEILKTLPSQGQTLLLLGDRSNMTPSQTKRALDWAAKGGHLLFVAERLWDEDEEKSGDLLLDSLGIQQYESETLDDEESTEAPTEGEKASSDPAPPAIEEQSQSPENEENAAVSYPELTQLFLQNEKAPAYINFDTRFHLYDAPNRAHAWANSESATHMIQTYHGDGLITVLTDSWIWQNDRIGEYDNAWLLWYMTQDSQVTLVYRADRDNLFTLLLRHFPQALVALALLLIGSLWYLGMRHGPIQQPASRNRRQLQEHLRASANFLLRHNGQTALLQTLQQDIQRRARQRHPGFERLPVAEQWQVLSRLSRQPTSAISQAMRPLTAQKLSAADFTRQVANLQTLRNAL